MTLTFHRTFTRLESCLDQPMDSGSVHEVIKYTPSTLPGYTTLLAAVHLQDGLKLSELSNHRNLLRLPLYMIFNFLSPLSATHYDADTTEPISCGLQTLEELLSWKRSEANPFNVAVVPMAPREPPLASCSRRTLVSHDMMGGYLDDRYGCRLRLL